MANLTTVKDSVDGWQNAVLVRDENTGRSFVVSTAIAPWAPEKPETLAYASDAEGTPESVIESIDPDAPDDGFAAPAWVAGGYGMNRDDAMADLSARLDDDVLLTRDQVAEANRLRFEEQQPAFMEWLFSGGATQLQDAATA